MTTVRLICGTCGKTRCYPIYTLNKKEITVECHGKPMLIAGEPQVDVHNLAGRGQGSLIDPVQNVTKRVFGDV